jgi:hypothetical protein
LNGVGDFFDLIPATNPSARFPWESDLTPEQVRMQLAKQGHCSVLVKLPYDYSDLFSSHSSWFTYGAMNRIFKHYSFGLSANFVGNDNNYYT